MTLLFVSHSAGDTDALIDTYRTMDHQSQQNAFFLALGAVARDKLTQANIDFESLDDILGAGSVHSYENKPLTENDLETVNQHLKKKQVQKALIGTPSKQQAGAPFQIAEKLANQLEYGAIYNDYLFFDPDHEFFKQLSKQKPWQKRYEWLAPVNSARDRFKAHHPAIKAEVAGHRALDPVLRPSAITQEHCSDKRQQLTSNTDDTLIFISGTKDVEQDAALLNAMLEALNTKNYPSIQVRVGIHPGVGNLQDYMDRLIGCMEQYPEVKCQTQLIVSQPLADKKLADLEKYDASLICRAQLNGDQAAQAADAVACSVPATLPNQAAVQGKPAYVHQDYESYLPHDRLFFGNSRLDTFFGKAQEKNQKAPLSNNELETPEQGFAETTANKLSVSQ